MSYELTAILHKVFPTEKKSGTFETREFVVAKTDGEHTNYIKFQLVQDRCTIVDYLKEGDEIKVFFDLRGREWQGKYFTNLQCWRIEQQRTDKHEPFAETSASHDNAPF